MRGPSSGFWGDRLAGGTLVALAILIAVESRSFTVGFLTDPLGPKALPLLAGSLVGLGGLYLFMRPDSATGWPGPGARARLVAAAASFLAYAALLSFLGFLLSTTVEMTVLSLIFGGRPARSAVGAALFAAALYAVFGFLVGLPLPTGRVFMLLGGLFG